MSTFSEKSFSGGEITPSLYARVDTAKYAAGLRTCRNFFVMRHGGVSNRPGTKFVGEVKDSSKTVRLIPFVFNASQTYVLEFGDLYLRVIKNGSYVVASSPDKLITGITQAFPAVITSVAHGFSNGDKVNLSSIAGMTELNGLFFIVSDKTADTFNLKYVNGNYVDSTGYHVYTSGGHIKPIFQLTTQYAYTDLPLLKFVQSADVITLTHPLYSVTELKRTADNNWAFTTVTFAPIIQPPTTFATNTGTLNQYQVTTVQKDTYEESLPSATQTYVSTAGDVPGTPSAPVNFTWTSVANAVEYDVYGKLNGAFGFLGIAGGVALPYFSDIGVIPDVTDSPPRVRSNILTGGGNLPSCCNYIQQRLMFANSTNNPETIWASKTSLFHNFTTSVPLQDDDAITFQCAGKQVNDIRHILELLGRMVVFTASGEWAILGGTSGIITPTGINPKQQSYNGSVENLAPIIINNTAIYCQARGNIIRDLEYDIRVDGYHGDDLTIFSAHLFDNYTLVDWGLQLIPHSIVWVARSDGKLLGLTYVREHQIFAWHRHDFSITTNAALSKVPSTVENICCVPEGNEDSVYLVIRRQIGDRFTRYVERFATRKITDITDSIFVDSCVTYDGTNTTAITMSLDFADSSLGNQAAILTASSSYFLSSDVGKAISITLSNGLIVRCAITIYTSATVVTILSDRVIDNTMVTLPVTTWAKAIKTMSGLNHLIGEHVSILADGFVVANPNNSDYPIVTVSGDTITLDKFYAKIHVGLPYISDIETLDIDVAQGETVADKSKFIGKVAVRTENTRGLFVGGEPATDSDPLKNLYEVRMRQFEDYDQPVSLSTDVSIIPINSTWNNNGRIFIRQVDPLPASILAVYPSGYVPVKGAG